MGVVTDWAVLDTPEEPMRMYMARPEGGIAGPGVLVIHDIFGLTEHIQDVCRRFADEGFVALAPDLYHRYPVKTYDYGDGSGALGQRSRLSSVNILDDLSLAFRFLAARGEVRSGLVGAVGFCSGGRDAFFLATQNPDLLAAVSFYGPLAPDQPESPLRLASGLEAPLLLIFAEQDHLIPPSEVALVHDTLAKFGKEHETMTHAGVAHGFFCDARPDSYAPEAAAEAWTRTIDFLYEKLEG